MIAHFVVQKLTSNKNAVQIVTIVLMVSLFGVAKVTVIPHINTWNELRSIGGELGKNVAFSALKDHDKAEYEQTVEGINEVIEGGGTRQDVIAAVLDRIEQIVKSNESNCIGCRCKSVHAHQ